MKYILLTFLFSAFSLSSYSQVSISDKPDQQAHPAAILELTSDNKGFILPRIEDSDARDGIEVDEDAESLLIFNKETKCIEVWVNDNWYEFWCLESKYDPEYIHCGDPTEIVEVYNPETGNTWMDRNLGASRACLSSDDEQCYGDLFQWGRFADGHQCRDWDGCADNPDKCHTTGLADTYLPDEGQDWYGQFITSSSDWLDDPEGGLWQGDGGVNDPCPEGFRLPTSDEFEEEVQSWDSEDAAGAFGSPLKLPVAGYRSNSNGSLYYDDTTGFYWSNNLSGNHSEFLLFNHLPAGISSHHRATGVPVRCIKDE